MIDSAIRLQNLLVLHSTINTAEYNTTVYGFSATFSDNSKIVVDDITSDLKLIESFAELLVNSDVEKVHFIDIIEDFIV